MNNQGSTFFIRTRYAIVSGYFFVVAFLNQLIADFLDWRLETKKRRWTAHGTLGAGMVPLGRSNMSAAIERTAKFGTVVSVDVEQAIVFYSEKR